MRLQVKARRGGLGDYRVVGSQLTVLIGIWGTREEWRVRPPLFDMTRCSIILGIASGALQQTRAKAAFEFVGSGKRRNMYLIQ